MLDFEHKEKGDVTVVYFFGKMDTGTSPEADKYVTGLVNDGAVNILVNLEELDFISSTGLRVILSRARN